MYKGCKGTSFAVEASFTPFVEPECSTHFGLLVLKNSDHLLYETRQSTLIRVLSGFLADYSFKDAVSKFLNFLLVEESCLQASLWWGSAHFNHQAAMTQVASIGDSGILSSETEALICLQLAQAISPEPGFVLTDVDRGSVYTLPLYIGEEVKGVLFMVLKEVSPARFSLYSRFLGRIFGLKLERKFLSQDLKDWVWSSPDPVLISGLHDELYQVSSALCELLNYSYEPGDSLDVLLTFLHPDDLSAFRTQYESLQPGAKVLFEGRFIDSLGEPIYASWLMTCSLESNLVYHVIRDSRQSHVLARRLEKAYALSRMGTWELDIQNNRVYWSQVTREIHEIDDPYYQPVLETAVNYYHPDDRPIIMAAVQACIEKAQTWDLKLRIITSKGNERWVRALGEGDFRDGECQSLFGTFMDIHAQKTAELAQAKHERILSLLNKINQQFLSESNWCSVLPEATRSFSEVLALDFMMYASITEKPCQVFSWPLSSQRDFDEINQALQLLTLNPGNNGFTVFSVQDLPTHTLIDYFESFSLRCIWLKPVFSEESQQGWLLLGKTDSLDDVCLYDEYFYYLEAFSHSLSQAISRRNTLNQLELVNNELKDNISTLAYANQELEQFAYIASHDLQEPLRMVTSFLNQLEKRYGNVLDERAHLYIEHAADGARRMRQIILDLLEYSRQGKPEQMIYQSINTNELMEGIKVLLSKKIKDTHAKLTWDVVPTLSAPAVPIRQVIQNLVGNALKYAFPERPPEIHITIREHADDWLFSVQDNGIGIEAEYFEKIFVIFQRLHNKSQYDGTGVGLALCKKIIDQCQGSIWVKSVLGQGSTFSFKIPKTGQI